MATLEEKPSYFEFLSAETSSCFLKSHGGRYITDASFEPHPATFPHTPSFQPEVSDILEVWNKRWKMWPARGCLCVCVCVDVEREAGPARCLPSGAFIRHRAKWKWCPSSYCRHPLPSKKVGLGWVAARGSKRAQNDEESRSEMQEQPSMRAASSSLSWAVFSAAEPSRHQTNTAFPGRN